MNGSLASSLDQERIFEDGVKARRGRRRALLYQIDSVRLRADMPFSPLIGFL